MVKVAMAVLIFMLGGCVTTGVMGKQITESQIAALEPGKTTYKEVKALWGQPQDESVQSLTPGSRELWVSYVRAVTKSSMSTLAILAGQSGTATKMKTINLRFDKNLILIERPSVHKSSSSHKF